MTTKSGETFTQIYTEHRREKNETYVCGRQGVCLVMVSLYRARQTSERTAE